MKYTILNHMINYLKLIICEYTYIIKYFVRIKYLRSI